MASRADDFATYLIVAAVVRRDAQVLLVQQQGPDDPNPSWALPGGLVEPGESLTDALKREVREETGLDVLRVGALAYVTHSVQTSPGNLHRHWESRSGHQTAAFVFEADEWTDELRPSDPDGFVLLARFVDISEALGLLADHPIRQMREPELEYLSGRAEAGAVWVYRTGEDGVASLDWRSG